MEERLNNFGDIIQAFAAPSDPLYEVIDNINIYRGTQIHLRLFKAFGPKMWNFAGRYLCKPFTHFIDKSLMKSEVFSAQPQRDIKHLVVDDILIGKLKWRSRITKYSFKSTNYYKYSVFLSQYMRMTRSPLAKCYLTVLVSML